MSMRFVMPENCVRARQHISLQLDSELSQFEKVLLKAHLKGCAACRALAVELEGLTGTLRAAAPEEPAISFQLPRRRENRVYAFRVYAFRAVSAAASVAVIALSGFMGLHLSPARTPVDDLRAARELTTFKEELLDRFAAGAPESESRTPAGLAAAEQLTVVSVAPRTNAPRRSSRNSDPIRKFGESEGR
jgi:hypothetical protein